MLQKQELHNNERSTAQISSLIYNTNRAKKAKPLSYLDFCMYKSSTDGSLPNWLYGACMQKALGASLFPSWAFFVYKDLSEAGGLADDAPSTFIATCDDVVVLGPQELNEGELLSGFFVLNEKASRKVRQIVTNENIVYTVEIPEIKVKYMADEELVVPILAKRRL